MFALLGSTISKLSLAVSRRRPRAPQKPFSNTPSIHFRCEPLEPRTLLSSSLNVIQQFAPSSVGTYPNTPPLSIVSIVTTNATAVVTCSAPTTSILVGDTVRITGNSEINSELVTVSAVNSAANNFSFKTGDPNSGIGGSAQDITDPNLGVITGNSLVVDAGGPYLTGQTDAAGNDGFSIDAQGARFNTENYNSMNISGTPAATSGIIDDWNYIDSINSYYDPRYLPPLTDIYAANGNTFASLDLAEGINITALSGDGTLATATVASTANMQNGDIVQIRGTNNIASDAEQVITVINSTQFTYSSSFVGTNNTNTMFAFDLNHNNDDFFVQRVVANNNIDTGVVCPLRQWFELRTEWNLVSGTTYEVSIDYRLAGSNTWFNIYNDIAAGGHDAFAAPKTADFGSGDNAGSPGFIVARYGMPTVASTALATWNTDRLSPIPNQHDPSTIQSHQWYYDPINGNDNNDGTTSAAAWKTDAKITAEGTNAGFFYAPYTTDWQTVVNGVPTGNAIDRSLPATTLMTMLRDNQIALVGDDVNVVVNPGQVYPIVQQGGIELQTDGLTFRSASATQNVSFSAFLNVNPNVWTNTTGAVYQFPQIGGTTNTANSVLFEDGRLLQQASGSTFAATEQQLADNPGTYFIDPSTSTPIVYIHSFESGNPATDGHLYQISNVAAVSGEAMGINTSGRDCEVENISVSGTVSQSPGQTPEAGYGISHITYSLYGDVTAYVGNFVQYSSKHSYATTSQDCAGMRTLYLNDTAQSSLGTQGRDWLFVDYESLVSGAGIYPPLHNQAAYYGCSSGAGSSLKVGSTVPESDQFAAFAWGTHGDYNNYDSFDFDNCDFSTAGGLSQQNYSTFTTENSQWQGALFGAMIGLSTETYIQCRIKNPINVTGGSAFLQNCIITTNLEMPGISNDNLTFDHCTIDWSGIGVGPGVWLLDSGRNNTLTFTNDLFIPGSYATGLIGELSATDKFTSSNNEIQGSNSMLWYYFFHNGANLTFGQSQSAGFESGSQTVATAAIDPISYQRTGQSSFINNVGSLTDYNGTSFPNRQTIGATEWMANTSSIFAGDVSTDFSNPLNWNLDTAPTAGQNALIPHSYSTIQIPSGYFTVHSLTANSPITITTGATLAILAPSTISSALTLQPGGSFDLTTAGLAINYGIGSSTYIATLKNYLATGAIFSSTIKTSPRSAIGYADGSIDTGTPAQTGQLLLKYTLNGDTNLDGLVNFQNLVTVIQHFNKLNTDWSTGNFNFGLSTNINDLVTVVQNFNKILNPPATNSATQTGGPIILLAAAIQTTRQSPVSSTQYQTQDPPAPQIETQDAMDSLLLTEN
jgi:hypothetical protein